MGAESLMSITRTLPTSRKSWGKGVRYGFRGIFTGRRPTFCFLCPFLKKMATIRQLSEQEKYVWMEIPHTLHAWKRSEAKEEMYGLHVHGTRMHARTWLALGGTHR